MRRVFGPSHAHGVVLRMVGGVVRARRTFAALAVAMAMVAGPHSTLHAQSVSPSIAQYKAATDGSFLVRNDGLTPLFVTLDTRSFTIDSDSNAIFSPLDKGIHLDLSQTSLRVPPHQQRTVYYKASADRYPAWFSVYANFSGLPRRNGLNVQLSLPHTVYLLGRQTVTANDVQFSGLHMEGSEVRGVLQNHGDNVVRVRELDAVWHGKNRAALGGFPLLPGGQRAFSLALPKEEKVEMIRAHFEKFTKEQALP